MNEQKPVGPDFRPPERVACDEANEIMNQLALVGELHGLSTRLNPALLRKWLESGGPDPDFRYEKQVRAAIKFADEVSGRKPPYEDKKDYFPFTPKDWPT